MSDFMSETTRQHAFLLHVSQPLKLAATFKYSMYRPEKIVIHLVHLDRKSRGKELTSINIGVEVVSW